MTTVKVSDEGVSSVEQIQKNVRKVHGNTIYQGDDPMKSSLQAEVLAAMPAQMARDYARLAAVDFRYGGDTSPPTQWETDMLGVWYLEARSEAQKTLILSGDLSVESYERYKEGKVSSSIETGVVIANTYIDLSRYLQQNLPVQNEVDVEGEDGDHGRRDMTYAVFENMSTVYSSDSNSLLGLRRKIPGDRFVKKGTKMIGFFSFDVPQCFPVKVAEYYGGVYHIIYPYLAEGFMYEGKQFVPHRFETPASYLPSTLSEGTMILIGELEYRTKRTSTVDVLVGKHTWECTLGDENTFIPIRPRPGKTPTPTPLFVAKKSIVGGDFLLYADSRSGAGALLCIFRSGGESNDD